MIGLLDRLNDSGELRTLVDAGIISVKFVQWRNIYHAYNDAFKVSGSKMQAMQDVADSFGISPKTVEFIRHKLD